MNVFSNQKLDVLFTTYSDTHKEGNIWLLDHMQVSSFQPQPFWLFCF